ncbi:MAG TPA: DUF805 domain-containing protein [Candidatus Paceibacterota bacterium]|nr:DUF805 domain-containing protein [Candidatus Paceibacterota bacterium]
MDLPTLNALLRVNGLTIESAPENIGDVLVRSGYSQDEIPAALAILKGAPSIPTTSVPAAYVEPIIKHTQTTTHIEGHSSLFMGRVGIRQFWIGMLITLLLYGLAFIVIEVSAVPIFSIISGISLFAPPDLATASVSVLLLFGIGMAMLILPAIFFLIISTGLQVRRSHDYGLSGSAWFMATLALVVGGYLLYRLTPLAALAAALSLIIWLVLVSLPGTSDDNMHGSPVEYPSVWGTLRGCFDERGAFVGFAKQFLLPLAYLEISGIVLGLCIHTLLPHIHLPSIQPPVHSAPSSTTIQI